MINLISENQDTEFSIETKIRKEKSVNLSFSYRNSFTMCIVNDHIPQWYPKREINSYSPQKMGTATVKTGFCVLQDIMPFNGRWYHIYWLDF